MLKLCVLYTPVFSGADKVKMQSFLELKFRQKNEIMFYNFLICFEKIVEGK